MINLLDHIKPIFHLANLFVRTDKKVGTLPTCSRRIFSRANFSQSRCPILIFASRRAKKSRQVENRLNVDDWGEAYLVLL